MTKICKWYVKNVILVTQDSQSAGVCQKIIRDWVTGCFPTMSYYELLLGVGLIVLVECPVNPRDLVKSRRVPTYRKLC